MTEAEKIARLKKDFDDVYAAGYEKGKTEGSGGGGYEEGFAAGRQAEKSDWWDTFQLDGKRIRYHSAFHSFLPELFFPKHNISTSSSAQDMFRQFGYKNGKKYEADCMDLAQRLIDCGVILDTSNSTSFNYVFYDTIFTRIPKIDFSGCDGVLHSCFMNNNYLIDVEIVLNSEGLNTYTSTFNNCPKLQNLVISGGVIGQNGLNLQWSVELSHDSFVSLVTALSTTTSGLSVTASLQAVNKAFETSEGAADGSTSAEWVALVATRPNWTINLI